MKEEIEKMLYQPVDITPYIGVESLPLAFRGNYRFFDMGLSGGHCILMEPQEEVTLTVLRKQRRRMEQITGQYCVLYLKSLRSYSREKMLEEGIPFIWENHQVYLPFLGMLLTQNEVRDIKPCSKLSFLTQKMLLTALYEQWQNATVTSTAEALKVSKMSVTRCFDEMEALGIGLLQKKGRTRSLTMTGDTKQQWEILKPFMRDPLIRTYDLEEEISFELPYSGMTALGEYSLISDNSYRTYAILKSQLAESGIKEKRILFPNEMPGCVVQELGYVINYRGGGAVDPLTLCLLMEKEREDPRVDMALDEMLEEYVW